MSPINTKGRTTTNSNNTTTTTPISSKEWQQNQSNNIGFNHSNLTSHNTSNPSNTFKDILDYNNHQASLVEDGDRDNNAAAIIGGGALGLEACVENPVGCAVIGGIAAGALLHKSLKAEKQEEKPKDSDSIKQPDSNPSQKREEGKQEGDKSQREKKSEENTQKKTNPKKEARRAGEESRENQPASEGRARWKARELEKEKGKDARRKGHDKKMHNQDRTKKDLDMDYDPNEY